MTRLNDTQQAILDKVRLEAERVAELDAAAKAKFEAAKEKNRTKLRALALEAAKASVPIRQFGMAAGTSDFNTIKALYPAKEDA